jgi:hypothetical protein
MRKIDERTTSPSGPVSSGASTLSTETLTGARTPAACTMLCNNPAIVADWLFD